MRSETVRWTLFPRAETLAFLSILSLYGILSAALLPVKAGYLRYILSLEYGEMAAKEWGHPLYVPVLGLYQDLLRLLFGYQGKMLVPVEMLHIGVSIAALTLLYVFVERHVRDPLVSGFSVLLLGFSPGFWFSHSA